jgi:serine protease Do
MTLTRALRSTPCITVIVAVVTALIVSSVIATVLPGQGEVEAVPGPMQVKEVRGGRVILREESAIIEAVRRAEPAVVSVIITKDLPVLERIYEQEVLPFDDFFQEFFGDPFFSPFELQVPRYRQKGTEKREVGGGTAFFVSTDGLLLTNKHVVADAEAEYTVLLNDGQKFPASVVARDPGNDIALLLVQGGSFPALGLAEEEVQLGQMVIAIGNALGEFRNTVSVGVVSGIRRTITAGSRFGGPTERLESIIQTDAAINEGNSGGPLLTTRGEVLGMNTAIALGAQNIGFAIPALDLRNAIESYRQHGKIVRAFLGVRYAPITPLLQEEQKLPYDYGALIVRGEEVTDVAVVPGSPADKAGLRENDIILEVDGQKLTGDVSLSGIIRRKSPGDTIRLTIFSQGKVREVRVKLGEQG